MIELPIVSLLSKCAFTLGLDGSERGRMHRKFASVATYEDGKRHRQADERKKKDWSETNLYVTALAELAQIMFRKQALVIIVQNSAGTWDKITGLCGETDCNFNMAPKASAVARIGAIAQYDKDHGIDKDALFESFAWIPIAENTGSRK